MHTLQACVGEVVGCQLPCHAGENIVLMLVLGRKVRVQRKKKMENVCLPLVDKNVNPHCCVQGDTIVVKEHYCAFQLLCLVWGTSMFPLVKFAGQVKGYGCITTILILNLWCLAEVRQGFTGSD